MGHDSSPIRHDADAPPWAQISKLEVLTTARILAACERF
jgi:hypothetical protein